MSAPYGRAPAACARLAAALTDEPATAQQLARRVGMTRQEASRFLCVMLAEGTAAAVPRSNPKAATRYMLPRPVRAPVPAASVGGGMGGGMQEGSP